MTGTNTQTTSTATLTRANRIAIQTTEQGYRADFYRTHKHLATLASEDTTWVADETANKSAQREDFRKWAIDHAEVVGILWNPNDLRTEDNRRIAKYETDEMLKEDATAMLIADLIDLTAGCGLGVDYVSLTADLITPMTKTAKGYDLSKMGVIDGKYEKTGNWAWAEIEMTLTLTKEGQEIYYTTKIQLVSGQLKKPHITKTSFTEDIKQSLKEIGLWEEPTKEAKAEKSAKADKVGLGDEEHEGLHMDMTAEEEAKAMAEAEEFLTKTTKKTRKSTKKTETAQA
jgi:hypothetical protein